MGTSLARAHALSLARTIIKTIKAPTEYSVLKTYTRHITLVVSLLLAAIKVFCVNFRMHHVQRRFMRDCPDKTQERGKLCRTSAHVKQDFFCRG